MYCAGKYICHSRASWMTVKILSMRERINKLIWDYVFVDMTIIPFTALGIIWRIIWFCIGSCHHLRYSLNSAVKTELVSLLLWPYHMPREFNKIFVTVTYIPPDANRDIAGGVLYDIIFKTENNTACYQNCYWEL